MSWISKLAISPQQLQLLVQSHDRSDLLKARLPSRARHPRALLTMLEGLALYSGGPICGVISADASVEVGCELGLFGNDLWPAESALVRLEPAVRAHPKRLRGLGDFRSLRRAARSTERSEP